MAGPEHQPTDMFVSREGGGMPVKVGLQCSKCLQSWPCEVHVLKERVRELEKQLSNT